MALSSLNGDFGFWHALKAIKCILREFSLHWPCYALCVIAVRYFLISYVQFHLWCCCVCLNWEAGYCQGSEWLTFKYLVIVIIIAMSSCWIIAFPTTCVLLSVLHILPFSYHADLSCFIHALTSTEWVQLNSYRYVILIEKFSYF